jgi:stage III sporulation protein AF
MNFIRTWILAVTAAAMVIAAGEALMPPGAVKKVGRLTGGLILALTVVQPLVTLDYADLADLVEALPANAIAEATPYSSMTPVIEEELEAYIAEKAAQLGLACTAEVTCAPGENDVPIPQEATITGDLTESQREALAEALTQDLGLSAEHLHFVSPDKEETP